MLCTCSCPLHNIITYNIPHLVDVHVLECPISCIHDMF